MAAMLAENYQLKWHSHGINLHSSIATLHRSESFSDVTLATADGRYVSAHRFVLSACSAYLHQLFQATRNAYPGLASGVGGGAPLVVVLPADIGYRTLSVLLQYMYSGEATVSQQQLDAVLRAGEILRIKGLCRTGGSRQGSASATHKERERGGRPTGVLTRQDPNRGDDSEAAGGHHHQLKTAASKRPASASALPPPAAHPPAKKAASLPPPASSASEASAARAVEDNQKENVEEAATGGGSDKQSNRDRDERESDEGGIGIEQSMQIELLVKEEPIEWDNMDAAPSTKAVLHSEMNIKSEIYSGDEMDAGEEGGDEEEEEEEEGDEEEEEEDMSAFYAPLTCDMCQQTFTTPALWVRHTETHPPTELPRRKAKRSTTDPLSTNGSGEGGGVEEEGTEAEYPPLRCELCQEVYSNPGDWVRHIQSAHTEEQLAISNQSSRPSRGGGGASTSGAASVTPRSRLPRSAAQAALNGRKHCPLCEKTFPSHASMLVHSRTHTGERPYECSVCAKEFNVKSNLLRHMRTLHDEIINPGNVRTAEMDSV
ncbi:hypothetical protein LSTR_LSTR007780 [Laodelphax striatellus]|uniref:BTB domain-containing protein n=1 Tax=Laodelphax striatellus TaxID=195883 RepID=A0A482XR88_LAOST|nr:hypothetical protein LSTR_LSTR007780 [Laodelphax striatellus]